MHMHLPTLTMVSVLEPVVEPRKYMATEIRTQDFDIMYKQYCFNCGTLSALSCLYSKLFTIGLRGVQSSNISAPVRVGHLMAL